MTVVLDDAERIRKIRSFRDRDNWQFDPNLVLDVVSIRDSRGKQSQVTVTYAPFEWVNKNATLVLVGITPGEDQARRAYRGAQMALNNGKALDETLRAAKRSGSFSGEMRDRLVDALDLVGLSQLMRLSSCAQFFDDGAVGAHFTSLVKFPVFVGTRGYDGKTPLPFLEIDLLRRIHQEYFLKEIASLKDALFLPLGQTVRARLSDLVAEGLLDDRQVLPWLLHPSQNNRNRYKYFLGKVSAEQASGDTNVANIDAMRSNLSEALLRIAKVERWQDLPTSGLSRRSTATRARAARAG